MTPKVSGTEMSRPGGPKLGWLKALNASMRNSAWRESCDVESLREHEIEVGVAGRTRDADRTVAERAERGAAAKAAISSQRSIDWSDGSRIADAVRPL